jgi:putative ABC transport system permease protein
MFCHSALCAGYARTNSIGVMMVKNYLKIAIRNITKQKTYSIINVSSLAIGLAVCLLISLYIKDELSYDAHHENADRIFRLISYTTNTEGNEFISARSSGMLGYVLSSDVPDIEHIVRFSDVWNDILVRHNEKKFYDGPLFFTDSTVFKILHLPFIYGNPKTALNRPNTIVITEKIAEKYFGNKNPLGETLLINISGDRYYEITGVIKNIPLSTHLHFNFLASVNSLERYKNSQSNWFDSDFYTYVKLKQNNYQQIQNQLNYLVEKYIGKELKAKNIKYSYKLQPIKDIYLHSNFAHEIGTGDALAKDFNKLINIRIFSIIAIFVLIIACFNYINLSTARSIKRAKEVGLRKVVGANQIQLIEQFIGESVTISILALIISLVIVEILLPWFNELTSKEIPFLFFTEIPILLILLSIFLIVGIIAGIYPAFILSQFQPIKALNSIGQKNSKGKVTRNILIVFQFIISFVLIVGTVIVFRQLHFMKTSDLGFDKEQILVLPFKNRDMMVNAETIKQEFLNHHSILSGTAPMRPPGRMVIGQGVRKIGEDKTNAIHVNYEGIDYDYMETFKLKLVAGRDFNRDYKMDTHGAYIINESASKALGWTSPEQAIGQKITNRHGHKWLDFDGEIIGVIKDFHFYSMHSEIQPLVLTLHPHIKPEMLCLKLATQNLPETRKFIETKWSELFPNYPCEYFFLDDDFNRFYQSDERLSKLVSIFSTLAIIIAIIGLLGLVSFTTEQMTKEIGIRKVLGASVTNIVKMLNQQFIKLLIVANVISYPIAYYVMSKWLQNFSYRINISLTIFIFVGIFVLFISILAVSYQTLRAATANPVDALHCE